MQNEKRKRRAKRKGDTPKVHRSYWPVKPGHHRKLSSVTTRCLNRKNVLPPHSPGFELFILRCGTQEIYSLLHDSMHLYGHLYVALFTSATPILELHLTPCCCFLFVSRAIELKNRDGQDWWADEECDGVFVFPCANASTTALVTASSNLPSSQSLSCCTRDISLLIGFR